jgi:hypothetical protein
LKAAACAVDFRNNELSLSFHRRVDVVDRPATLVVNYDGEKVLVALWTIDGLPGDHIRPVCGKTRFRMPTGASP